MRNLGASIIVWAVLLAGCGAEAMVENPSCCLYECTGGRTQWFSMYFGTEAQCDELAQTRCDGQFPDTPGLARIDYADDVDVAADGPLNATCERKFMTFTSTVPVAP